MPEDANPRQPVLIGAGRWVMDTVAKIGRFIRWKDWGPGKLTILWSLAFYIVVAYKITPEEFFLTFLVFMLFAATQSAFGFVMNDWGDRELDRRQFKYNTFNGMSELERMLALALIVVMAIATGMPLALRPGFLMLWLLWVATSLAYSLEPLRLKTKGMVGLVVSFVAQWFLPVLLIFSAFGVHGHLDMWLIAGALTLGGATLELAHQRWDRERDKATRAHTFAVSIDENSLDRLYALALLLDKLAVGVVVGVASNALMQHNVRWGPPLALVLIGAYAALLLASLRGALVGLMGGPVDDPHYGSQGELPSPAKLLHQTLLNLLVPFVLGLAAVLQSQLYAIPLALFLMWRLVLGRANLRIPVLAAVLRRVRS